MIVGTIGYISPEHVQGQVADARSDLFSLGVVLYEIATGRRTFERQTTIETLNAILKEDPVPPVTVAVGLWQVISHCLEKDPTRRFQSSADVAFALRSFAATTTASRLRATVSTVFRVFGLNSCVTRCIAIRPPRRLFQTQLAFGPSN